MEKGAIKSQKKEVPIPPKRGQIKKKIFSVFVKSIATLGSKGKDGNSSASSTSTTAPASAYTSDGYSDP